MLKRVLDFVLICHCCIAAPFASKGEHEQKRVEEAGEVLKEILDIPDNIPKELLDRAECLIVLPGVKKLAIGSRWKLRARRDGLPFGAELHGIMGSSGDVCVGGSEYRTSARRPGNGLRSAGDEPEGGNVAAVEQSETGWRCVGSSWSERDERLLLRLTSSCRRKSFLFAITRVVCRDVVRGFYAAF